MHSGFLAAGMMAVAAFAEPAFAQVALDAATQARINADIDRAREIYAHDQAAWHGTDLAREHLGRSDEQKIHGWVTERLDQKTVRIIFLRTDLGRPAELFSADVQGSAVIASKNFLNETPPPLPDNLAKQYAATTKVRELLGNQICGRPPNLVTLPSVEAPGGLDVYAIVPEFTVSEAVMAGHKRFTFDARGGEPKEHDYSNSCLIMQRPASAVALTVSVPPDRGDIPNEMHDFASLNLHLQLFVLTSANGRAWGIADGIPLLLKDGTTPAGKPVSH